MTKEEFINKYIESIIVLPFDASKIHQISREEDNRGYIISKVVRELGLNCIQIIPFFFPNVEIKIFDSNDQFVKDAVNRYYYEEFSEDLNNLREWLKEEKNRKEKEKLNFIYDLLSEYEIEGKIEQDITEERWNEIKKDYIQGLSTLKAALFWKPNGSRIFIVCGKGLYLLTNI